MRPTRNKDMGLKKTVGGVQGQSWSETVNSNLEEELKFCTQSTYFPCSGDLWVSKEYFLEFWGWYKVKN